MMHVLGPFSLKWFAQISAILTKKLENTSKKTNKNRDDVDLNQSKKWISHNLATVPNLGES